AISKECLGGKRGYVKVPPMSSKTVTVRAEKPLYVSLSTLANGSGGTLYFSFIPHKAEHYAVTYQVLPGPSGRDSMDIKAFDSQEQPVKLSIGTGAWPRCNNK